MKEFIEGGTPSEGREHPSSDTGANTERLTASGWRKFRQNQVQNLDLEWFQNHLIHLIHIDSPVFNGTSRFHSVEHVTDVSDLAQVEDLKLTWFLPQKQTDLFPKMNVM